MNDLAPHDRAAEVDLDVDAERRRSRRSVSFIVSVVALAVVVIGALALWVTVVPYDVEVSGPGGEVVPCDASTAPTDPCDAAEADAREDRRTTALLIGVGAFVVATAVSTWPSRRLTGDRLGPLR